MTVNDLKDGFYYGMHGCGFYSGALRTNSKEAMEYWLAGGVSIMEIDISRTIDGKYVALAHAMTPKYLKRIGILDYTDKDAFTYNWFMKQALCSQWTDGLTPLDLESIIEKMDKHSNLIVMFDLWGLFTKQEAGDFAKELSQIIYNGHKNLEERILVEAYNQPMIDGIRENGGDGMGIIYCVEDSSPVVKHQQIAPLDLKKQGINVISYPWNYLKSNISKLQPFKEEDLVVFSVSKDNRNARYMKEVGVNVNLVDMRYHWWKFPFEFMNYAYGRLKYYKRYEKN